MCEVVYVGGLEWGVFYRYLKGCFGFIFGSYVVVLGSDMKYGVVSCCGGVCFEWGGWGGGFEQVAGGLVGKLRVKMCL